jgi:hypothetical protein
MMLELVSTIAFAALSITAFFVAVFYSLKSSKSLKEEPSWKNQVYNPAVGELWETEIGDIFRVIQLDSERVDPDKTLKYHQGGGSKSHFVTVKKPAIIEIYGEQRTVTIERSSSCYLPPGNDLAEWLRGIHAVRISEDRAELLTSYG